MIGFVILLSLGVLLLWLSWRNHQKVQASMSWQSVTGRILSAEVREQINRGNADEADQYTYTPEVRYEYQVGGQTYPGTRLAFSVRAYSSAKQAMAAVQALQPGMTVPVFYDPGKPQDAVLERKAPANWLPAILGAVLVLVAFVILIKR